MRAIDYEFQPDGTVGESYPGIYRHDFSDSDRRIAKQEEARRAMEFYIALTSRLPHHGYSAGSIGYGCGTAITGRSGLGGRGNIH